MRKQAEIHVIVGHLVDDPRIAAAIDRRQVARDAARPGGRPLGGSRSGMQSRGRPVRPSRPGIASKDRRARRNSPAPWIWEWLASTCSINVVPERGRPKTKTGRRLGEPAPASRANKSRSNSLNRPSTNRSCSTGDVVAAFLVRPRWSARSPRAGIRRPGRNRPGRRVRGPGRTRAGRAGPRPACHRSSRSSRAARSSSGSLPRKQRRQPGVGQRERRLHLERRAEGFFRPRQVAQLLLKPT